MFYYVDYKNLKLVKSETKIDTSIYGQSMLAEYNSLSSAGIAFKNHLNLLKKDYYEFISQKWQYADNFK